MGEVEAVQTLLTIDYIEVIIGVVTIIVAICVVKKFYSQIIELFNIETPSMKKENERKKEIDDIKEQINFLCKEQQELAKQSEETDEKLQSQISSVNELLKSLTIASMRSMLWNIYSESKSQGFITIEKLKIFTECGKVYEDAGGDDIYHEKLYPEVMSLEVHDDDIGNNQI